MAKIGIFGGSFNPPHLGHILAAQEFQKQLQLDALVFVPAAQPPHKQLPPDTPAPQIRLELLKLAAQTLPFARVNDLELQRQGASYTVDTLRQLRETYPEDQLYLCMGTDMFLTLDSWYRPEEICRMAIPTMVSRRKDDPELLCAQAEKLKAAYGTEPVILPNTYVDVSSTTVRRMLILGGAQDYLPEPVWSRIRELGLYGTARNRKNLSFEDLQRESLALHKPKRVPHVIGCSNTAAELAQIYGVDPDDARRAGILHDVTKALEGEDQLRLCREYDLQISQFEREHTKLLHSVTGSAVARHVFGENEAVCQSIWYHTSGRANMSTLEKILYVADYIEPNRDFPGVEELRRLAYTDLDAALLLGLEMTAEHLNRQGAEMGYNSVEAMAYLRQRKDLL